MINIDMFSGYIISEHLMFTRKSKVWDYGNGD
jgi:hypothetical protein